jgi:heme a synthase
MTSIDSNPGNGATPRWLHWWAVLTVLFALPLLTLGAEVTTKKVGMADLKPLRPIDYLFQLIREHEGVYNLVETVGLGPVIEHGHRTFGWAVGALTIGLALGLTFFQQRRWLRWAGWAALVAVSTQGFLGGLRVDWNQRFGPDAGTTVALIHGCSAQLVFALLVSIALWTSAGWQGNVAESMQTTEPTQKSSEGSGWISKTAPALLVAVMYVQIVFGAIMRHKELALGTRIHVLLAFAVVAVSVWVGAQMLQDRGAGTLEKKAVWTLWALLAVQLVLGLETLFSKFEVRWGYTGERLESLVAFSELVRSVHFLVGALTFAAAVSLALVVYRNLVWGNRLSIASVAPGPRQLEGAL